MKQAQQQVREFMVKAGQETPLRPTVPPPDVKQLRVDLINEELEELAMSFECNDRVEIADAIGDLLVVVLGTAVACGIEIAPIFEEIMRSNMTKFIDGHKRKDGKWIKGPSYSPANLLPIVAKQERYAHPTN